MELEINKRKKDIAETKLGGIIGQSVELKKVNWSLAGGQKYYEGLIMQGKATKREMRV